MKPGQDCRPITDRPPETRKNDDKNKKMHMEMQQLFIYNYD
jgi:hypothetical protein